MIMRVTAKVKEQTRDRILRAARKLFSSKGFDHTTTRDIARRATIAALAGGGAKAVLIHVSILRSQQKPLLPPAAPYQPPCQSAPEGAANNAAPLPKPFALNALRSMRFISPAKSRRIQPLRAGAGAALLRQEPPEKAEPIFFMSMIILS